MDNDIIIRVVNMPLCVKGVTVPGNDGTYNVYINGKYCIEMQNEILMHELRHIENYDFQNFESIRIVEKRANIS